MSREIEIPNNEMTAFDLPPVCIVTGSTENVVFKPVKFSWYPKWTAVTVLISPLIFAILAAILTKRSKGELPFTEAAYKAWRTGRVAYAFSIVGAIALLFGMIFAFAAESVVLGLLCLVAMFAAPITVYFTMARNRGPAATKVTDSHTTLKFPSDAAADAIAAHLVGGAAKPAMVPVLPPYQKTA